LINLCSDLNFPISYWLKDIAKLLIPANFFTRQYCWNYL